MPKGASYPSERKVDSDYGSKLRGVLVMCTADNESTWQVCDAQGDYGTNEGEFFVNYHVNSGTDDQVVITFNGPYDWTDPEPYSFCSVIMFHLSDI